MSPAATRSSTTDRDARIRDSAPEDSSTGSPRATATTSSIERVSPTTTGMLRRKARRTPSQGQHATAAVRNDCNQFAKHA